MRKRQNWNFLLETLHDDRILQFGLLNRQTFVVQRLVGKGRQQNEWRRCVRRTCSADVSAQIGHRVIQMNFDCQSRSVGQTNLNDGGRFGFVQFQSLSRFFFARLALMGRSNFRRSSRWSRYGSRHIAQSITFTGKTLHFSFRSDVLFRTVRWRTGEGKKRKPKL